VYSPYARGSETEIADKALAGERFTEPHYQRQAQRYLGHAVRALRAAGREVSLAGLVEALDPAGLELLARQLPQESARAVHAYLDSLTPRQRSDLTGVRDRLAIMAESDVGPWLDPATAGAECFDLLDAVRTGAVVYFSLQADSRPLLAQMVGSAIVQDLQTVVCALQDRPARCLVAIDEFSAIAAEHVARLFARARSAGVSLLLGTQELSDLRLPGRETLLEQVLGNLTSVIAHRQAVPQSAELIARLAGSRGAWRTSVSSDGRSTRTRVSEPLISAEEVMSLARGHAAVIRLSSPRSAAIVRMHSPEQS
jgi:type IV secretory pathway TraG/TraD family ATPase VirD4